MIVVERLRPGRVFPTVRRWWLRAIATNLVQIGVVFLARVAWDGWLQRHRPWVRHAARIRRRRDPRLRRRHLHLLLVAPRAARERGTFRNPRAWDAQCGFDDDRELRLADLLLGRDVNA